MSLVCVNSAPGIALGKTSAQRSFLVRRAVCSVLIVTPDTEFRTKDTLHLG